MAEIKEEYKRQKFLIDAQLPPSLSKLFARKGFDAVHACDIRIISNPSDNFLNQLSIRENRIVITKDTDFYHTFILKQQPYKLILIRVGNLKKKELISVFEENFARIISSIAENNMIELSLDKIVILY